jgi:hypothetical protein
MSALIDMYEDEIESLQNKVLLLEEENKKLKQDSISYNWLFTHGYRYTEAVRMQYASHKSGRGPYILLEIPSVNGTIMHPTKEMVDAIVNKAINDSIEEANRNYTTCKKCNSDRTKMECFYPHACGFVGTAYIERDSNV